MGQVDDPQNGRPDGWVLDEKGGGGKGVGKNGRSGLMAVANAYSRIDHD